MDYGESDAAVAGPIGMRSNFMRFGVAVGPIGASPILEDMDRRQPLLLNEWEAKTDDALAEAAERCGLRVCAKVRLGSALGLQSSGLSDDLFRYGTRAELDFVIADGANALPQFAIEYDGWRHLNEPRTKARDRMKQEICSRLGLPLVRIGSEYLERERRFTLIGYLIEVWNMERAFRAAQEAGQIPYDEPFIPEMVIAEIADLVEATRVDWPYALDQPARMLMVDAERAGRLVNRTPEEVITPWRQPDEAEIVEAYALLQIRPEGYIVGRARLRTIPCSSRACLPGAWLPRLPSPMLGVSSSSFSPVTCRRRRPKPTSPRFGHGRVAGSHKVGTSSPRPLSRSCPDSLSDDPIGPCRPFRSRTD